MYSVSICDSSFWAHIVTAGTGVLEQKMGDCGSSALHIYSFFTHVCLSVCLPASPPAFLTLPSPGQPLLTVQ